MRANLNPLNLWPTKITSRLFALDACGVFAVLALATASIYFANDTRYAARYLYEDGLVGVVEAGKFELLLERHRRIIEAAPVKFDRVRVDRDRRVSEEIIDELKSMARSRKNYYLGTIDELLPEFTQHSRRVLYLVANYSQDGALEAISNYVASANRIAVQISRYKDNRLESADNYVGNLSGAAATLVGWVVVAAVLALILIGPLSFMVVRNITKRVNHITQKMRELAANDTSIAIRYLDQNDEVGDIARAVQVFKKNAIVVLAQRRQLKTLNFFLDVAMNNMGRGLSMFDADEKLTVSNRTYQEIYDLPPELCRPGAKLYDVLAHRQKNGLLRHDTNSIEVDAWHKQYVQSVGNGKPFESSYLTSNGRVISIHYHPLETGGCVALHEDITEKREAEEKIRKLAECDTLTGLANRHQFRTTLKHASNAFLKRKVDGTAFAVILIDLDRFKEVNDTLGHPTGDALLKVVAERLKEAVRCDDIVARLGGDEFAVLQRGISSNKSAKVIADRILDSISEPYTVLGQHVTIGASIGIAHAPEHGFEHDEILKKADIALYRAKDDGRGCVRFFEADLETKLREKRTIETELRDALPNNEMQLHYQPIVDLASGQVTSCEALMRWQNPERGFVSPGQFIPIAEDIGLITELGSWALNQACMDAVKWPETVAVSVNLSAVQFDADDLYATVRKALQDSGLSSHRLHLEVTETLLLDNNTKTRRVLHKLRADGVRISLDDFGTGFSSLSYLRSFPFDKIKIDQSFIRSSGENRQNIAIVRAVAELAQTLGMRTVAEGVETAQHLTTVQEAGCNEVQGYLFSKPVPQDIVLDVISGCPDKLSEAA